MAKKPKLSVVGGDAGETTEKKKRGRPAGSGKKAAPASTTDMTPEQEGLLLDHHVGRYEPALAAKKKADADFKNVCKLAKAEGISLSDIKKRIELRTPEGEAKLKADIERTLQIAKWAGMPLGAQAGFDFTDRRPAVDRAREEGRQAGRRGEVLKPPYANELPQYDSFVEGWHQGQKEIASFQKERDAKAFEEKAGPQPGAEPDLGDRPGTGQTVQ